MTLDEPMHVGAVIGGILILLGFFALVMQRIYIDPRTNAPSEIELPMLGKMKANYPALIFPFLGAAIVVIGFNKHEPDQTVTWLVDGQIVSDKTDINWKAGTHLAIFPEKCVVEVRENGRFTIQIPLKKGRAFEDTIELIQISNPAGRADVVPKAEFEKKNSGKGSNLITATPTARRYRVPFEPMPQ